MRNKLRYVAGKEKQTKRALLFLFVAFCIESVWPLWVGELANPYTESMTLSGHYSLTFLILCLLITPLRRWLTILCQRFRLSYGKRLADWNFIIRYRRRLGLFSAAFACLHFSIYLWVDMGLLIEEIVWDLQERTFIQLGWLSLIIIAVLSITSPVKMQKRLKRKWRIIHRSIYILILLVMLHFSESLKAGEHRDNIWWVAVILLLIHRLIFRLLIDRKNQYDTGLEAKRTPKI